MQSTETYGIAAAHRMVKDQQKAGNDVRWEGFDTIIFHRPADHAEISPQGALRNGKWGFENRFVVNSEGKWEIDVRNLRRPARRSRR